MKKWLLAALVTLFVVPVASADGVHVSFGTPYAAGPNPMTDGWYVPVNINTYGLTDFLQFASAPGPAPHRNIEFRGNIKPVMYCWDPPWLPGTQILCGASTTPGAPDGFLLDGNYWPVGPIPRTAGYLQPESYNDPDTAFMELAFRENSQPGCLLDAASGVALSIRVVKRYNTSETGLITLAPPGDGKVPFHSQAVDCDGAAIPLTVGPPLVMPPLDGNPGGTCPENHICEEPAQPRRASFGAAVWFDLQGRALAGRPAVRGVYLYRSSNGTVSKRVVLAP